MTIPRFSDIELGSGSAPADAAAKFEALTDQLGHSAG